MPAGSGACSGVVAHSAINGHWSQSPGDDLSGQHGMSALTAAWSDIAAMVVDPAAFARPASGAIARPTITRIASSRRI